MGTMETQGNRKDDGRLGQGSGKHTVFMVEARLAPGVDPFEPITLEVNRAEDGGHSGLVRSIRLTHEWKQIPRPPRHMPPDAVFDLAQGYHATHAEAMAHAWTIVTFDPAVRIQTCVTPVDISFSFERKVAPIEADSTNPFRSIQFCGYPPFGDGDDERRPKGLEAGHIVEGMHTTGLRNFGKNFLRRCMQIGRTFDLKVGDPSGGGAAAWRIEMESRYASYIMTAQDGYAGRWSSYVGCIMTTNDGKGRDLADGRYIEETWQQITGDIRRWEENLAARASMP